MTSTLSANPISLVIRPRSFERAKGFVLRRNLLNVPNLRIGPFMVFDHFDVTFEAGRGLDARPHPHCGIAPLSYNFEGTVLHRTSAGDEQLLEPGGTIFTVAGKGVAHSERTPASSRAAASRLAGVQLWVALPEELEETEPRFESYGPGSLPVFEQDGVRARVVAGRFGDCSSPVTTFSPTICADVAMKAGSRLALPVEYPERGVYVLDGETEIAGERLEPQATYVLRPGEEAEITARSDARFLLVGGAPIEGPRYVCETLVASSKARLERVKALWNSGGFPNVRGEDDRGEPIA